MERPLYLYEHVDVVGQGAYEYMEHLKVDPTEAMPSMTKLQGTFYTIGMTGRWPQVINIWDMPGGWDGFRQNVDRLNLKRRKAFYEGWWDEAAKWRSGGFDRICVGVEAHARMWGAWAAARGLSDEHKADDRLLAWERRALEYTTRRREELMTPRPGCVYAPDDYETPTDSDAWAKEIRK